jgi:hypothetical protein
MIHELSKKYRAEELVDAINASERQDALADYLQRGRRFGTLDDQALLRRWFDATAELFRWARTGTDEPSFVVLRDVSDLPCEFDLRGITPPNDAASLARAAAFADRIEADGSLKQVSSQIVGRFFARREH